MLSLVKCIRHFDEAAWVLLILRSVLEIDLSACFANLRYTSYGRYSLYNFKASDVNGLERFELLTRSSDPIVFEVFPFGYCHDTTVASLSSCEAEVMLIIQIRQRPLRLLLVSVGSVLTSCGRLIRRTSTWSVFYDMW